MTSEADIRSHICDQYLLSCDDCGDPEECGHAFAAQLVVLLDAERAINRGLQTLESLNEAKAYRDRDVAEQLLQAERARVRDLGRRLIACQDAASAKGAAADTAWLAMKAERDKALDVLEATE